MGDRTFKLPVQVLELIKARDSLKAVYGESDLRFTLDGNLIGDLGEAIAARRYGIELVRAQAAIDGHAPDGRTVQIKATTTDRGPAFRNTEARADHLLFFSLDMEQQIGTVVFNGPEKIARDMIGTPDFKGQRSLTRAQIIAADKKVNEADRLKVIKK